MAELTRARDVHCTTKQTHVGKTDARAPIHALPPRQALARAVWCVLAHSARKNRRTKTITRSILSQNKKQRSGCKKMGGIDPQVAIHLQLVYISTLAFVESKRKLTPFFPLG